MVVHLSYNVASRNDLAGLGQLMVTYKPDFVFLQEVTRSKEQLEAILGRSYDCQVNLNPDDENQPGTAVAWRNTLDVEVIPVITGRIQLVKSEVSSFINIYANSGTKGEAARRVLFG